MTQALQAGLATGVYPRLTCGVATGWVVAGVLGEPGAPAYGAIGLPVLLADELAALAETFGVGVLACEETVAAARSKVLARELDMISLAGDRRRLKIFEVLGESDDFDRFAGRFTHYPIGLAAYRARRWHDACRHLEAALAAADDDRPARILLERCQRLAERDPGEDWIPVTAIRRLS